MIIALTGNIMSEEPRLERNRHVFAVASGGAGKLIFLISMLRGLVSR